MPLILSGNSGNTTLDSSNGLTFSDNSLQGAAASPFGLKNRLINGEMDVWQRGTSFTISGGGNTYTADRWCNLTQLGTYSRSTDVPTGFQYSLSIASTSTFYGTISQRIESANSTDLVGQTITVSFWAKATTGGAAGIGIGLDFATAVDNFTSFTNIGVASTSALTSTWTRYTATFSSLPAGVANGLQITFFNNAGGVSAITWLITGVQLEIGTSATPFERRMYGTELAMCQRYYQTLPFDGGFVAVGAVINTTSVRGPLLQLNVNMRAAPTVTLPAAGSGAGQLHYTTSSGAVPGTIGTNSVLGVQVNSFRVEGDSYTSAFTAGQTSLLRLGSGGASITASAEL